MEVQARCYLITSPEKKKNKKLLFVGRDGLICSYILDLTHSRIIGGPRFCGSELFCLFSTSLGGKKLKSLGVVNSLQRVSGCSCTTPEHDLHVV